VSEPARGAPSKRFTPSKWTRWLVPALLGLLLLGLLITLAIVLLAVFGLMPASVNDAPALVAGGAFFHFIPPYPLLLAHC
jgi:hypothetical protein